METPKPKQTSLCSICIDLPATTAIDSCSHLFCLKCIRKWSKTQNSCPLCRQKFLEIIKGKTHYKVNPPKPITKNSSSSANSRLRNLNRRIVYIPIVLNPNLPIQPPANLGGENRQNGDYGTIFPFQNWNFLQNNAYFGSSVFFLPPQ